MVAGVQATMLTEPSAHDSCASLDPVSAVSGRTSHSDGFGYGLNEMVPLVRARCASLQ